MAAIAAIVLALGHDDPLWLVVGLALAGAAGVCVLIGFFFLWHRPPPQAVVGSNPSYPPPTPTQPPLGRYLWTHELSPEDRRAVEDMIWRGQELRDEIRSGRLPTDEVAGWKNDAHNLIRRTMLWFLDRFEDDEGIWVEVPRHLSRDQEAAWIAVSKRLVRLMEAMGERPSGPLPY